MKITRKQMVNAVGNVDKVDILLHYINIYLDVFEINTPLRATRLIRSLDIARATSWRIRNCWNNRLVLSRAVCGGG